MAAVLVVTSQDGGDPTQEDLQYLADSVDNVIPFVADPGRTYYYRLADEIMLIAPGGEVVAAGTYASDIGDDAIQAVLP